jgi:hypothetical protein
MKTKLLLTISFIFTLLFQSCSNDSDGPNDDNTTGVNQELITGWWYRGQNAPIYKAYYFGSDSEYKQDGSNFGISMGIGTWSWETSTKIKVIPVSGIAGGNSFIELTKLTNDSLVGTVGSNTLRLSRTNHN